MWVLEKLKETLPLDLGQFLEKNEEELRPSSRLHCNIITPDKIPEFSLPPRLCKTIQTTFQNQIQDKNFFKTNLDPSVLKTPLSAESYGLTGNYERPNTRRKESLFHSKRPVYSFDRGTAAPRTIPKTVVFRRSFVPLFRSISSLSETNSSTDSSPLSSPCSDRSKLPSASARLRGAASCPSLSQGLKRSPVSLSPPVVFPLDVLQCQERLQREHVLPLVGRGTVRFAIERSSVDPFSSLSTVRLRVVSVENRRVQSDAGTLSCAVRVCLMPGRLQRQKSATIRQCRSPVFNEDFFFTELSDEELMELQLKIKVVDKAGAGSLRRAAVVGVITKPLCLLLLTQKKQ